MCADTVILSVNSAMKQEAKNDGDSATTEKIAARRNFAKSHFERVVDITTSADAKLGRSELLIEPKKCNMPPEEFMNHVIDKFGLEASVPIRLFAISTDKRPRVRSIKDLIAGWIEFRKDTLRMRLQTKLTKIEKRLELVNGRLKVIDRIQDVINIIQNSDDPKEQLIDTFSLSERQAEDILEIKLRELGKLQTSKLEDEKEVLETEHAKLTQILNSDARLNTLLVREAEKAAKEISDERKTLLLESKPVTTKEISVAAEPVTIYITRDNWIVSRKGHITVPNEAPTQMLQGNDEFKQTIMTKSDKKLVALTVSGRVITCPVSSIPSGRSMSHVNTLIATNGEQVYSFVECNEDGHYLLAQDKGYGFVIEGKSLISKMKAGKDVFKLTDGANIAMFEPIADNKYFSLSTSRGRLLRMDVSEMMKYQYPKGKGVALANLTGETVTEFNLTLEDVFIHKGVITDLERSVYHKKRAAAPALIK